MWYAFGLPIGMIALPQLDQSSGVPLYRQLYEHIRENIELGLFRNGAKLPATRELASQLGLNRATISAAYTLLESDGLIKGYVGRGSFVTRSPEARVSADTAGDWISFASSSPAQELFPLAEFQQTCAEVTASAKVFHILQLGSPGGYGLLREYLLAEARAAGAASDGDDILVTSGCQQAIDLIARCLAVPGEPVAVEDPVYVGLKNAFLRAGQRMLAVPVHAGGMDLNSLERTLLRDRPRLVVVTSNFQNPTGATLPLDARRELVRLVSAAGAVLVENDIYGELRYQGEPLPTLKALAPSTVLLRSYSKLAFPGLRVGWVIAPREIIARLIEAKQWCDLHTDQLAQAIMLRFAQSGRLASHRDSVCAAGAARLAAVLAACERHLPAGSEFTRPQGGMNLWVRLPRPLDASELLAAVERSRVSYLPGRYFTVEHEDPGAFRLSFGGLAPAAIEAGLERLGAVFAEELGRARRVGRLHAAPAMV